MRNFATVLVFSRIPFGRKAISGEFYSTVIQEYFLLIYLDFGNHFISLWILRIRCINGIRKEREEKEFLFKYFECLCFSATRGRIEYDEWQEQLLVAGEDRYIDLDWDSWDTPKHSLGMISTSSQLGSYEYGWMN